MSPTDRPDRARLGLVLLAGALVSGCIVVPANRYDGRRGAPHDDDDPEVTTPPPEPQAEVVIASPGPEFFWIAGYWGWIGGRYAWVGGHWERHRPGWFWVPFAWTRHGHGWRGRRGHWRRR